MRFRSMLAAVSVATALLAPLPALAAQSAAIPAWLTPYVGEGKGQIAAPVLQRARALYLTKLSSGAVRNPCYFAMDATRPNDGSRFYIICEANHSFRTIAAGHGSGRNLKGLVDYSNGRECAKNFGNAMDSDLTTGPW